jgi:hypothetical protein
VSAVVTFYSFKGGVGRTMALANVAVLLAQAGHRVLAIDWDLEAPGLDRYLTASRFRITPPRVEGAGLIDLLTDSMESREPADWQRYTTEVALSESTFLTMLSCGKQDARYAGRVLDFDWENFFRECNGGDIVECWRREWLEHFDVTLIDSRTGITDSGGVCTIQLPDILVPVFTTNDQSLGGAIETVRQAQRSRQLLAFDRSHLMVLPLPSRFDGRVQYKEGQEWLRRFADELREFYADWLPRDVTPMQILERTKIPYVAYFSFGEKLPVLDEGTTDPESVGYAYAVAAKLLGSEFADAASVARFGVVDNDASPSPDMSTTLPLGSASASATHDCIYLAVPSVDMHGAYDRVHEELSQRGYAVVPPRDDDVPRDVNVLPFLRSYLKEASLSIHLVGLSGGWSPGGDLPPIVLLQLNEASARVHADSDADHDSGDRAESFRRVIWAPKIVVDADGAVVAQRDPVEALERFGELSPGDVVNGGFLSTFTDNLIDVLERRRRPASLEMRGEVGRAFLLHAREDAELAISIAKAIQSRGLDAVFPVFEGSRREVEAYNRSAIRDCGFVIVCWGNAADVRVRAMLQDVSDLQRGRSALHSTLVIGPPPSTAKEFSIAVPPRGVNSVVNLTEHWSPEAIAGVIVSAIPT